MAARSLSRRKVYAIIREIIATNPDKAEQARQKPALVGWFIGQVMKATGGRSFEMAAELNRMVEKKLGVKHQTLRGVIGPDGRGVAIRDGTVGRA